MTISNPLAQFHLLVLLFKLLSFKMVKSKSTNLCITPSPNFHPKFQPVNMFRGKGTYIEMGESTMSPGGEEQLSQMQKQE